uniref:phosphopantetheine-binding protein n=2 Tax=unclassified Pseudoalteromonas TaxID=194690 RepID=UPI002353DC20
YSDDLGCKGKVYKTGDLVRYGKDGLIEYVGRVDDQIKIRGFRVEPGEVQRQLEILDGVARSLVIVTSQEELGKKLIAYVELKESVDEKDEHTKALSLSSALSAKLPSYMVPVTFVFVCQWPLTVNGKVDKKALPIPSLNNVKNDYLAPNSEIECALVEIVARLVGLPFEKISMSDNFFDLGGHSLMLMRLLSEIKDKWHVQLNISEMFDCQYLSELAELLLLKTKLLEAFDTTDVEDSEEVIEI